MAYIYLPFFFIKHYPHLEVPLVSGDPSGVLEIIIICQTEQSDKAPTVVAEGLGLG